MEADRKLRKRIKRRMKASGHASVPVVVGVPAVDNHALTRQRPLASVGVAAGTRVTA